MIYRPIQYVCAFVWKGAEKVIGREEKESGSRSSTRCDSLANQRSSLFGRVDRARYFFHQFRRRFSSSSATIILSLQYMSFTISLPVRTLPPRFLKSADEEVRLASFLLSHSRFMSQYRGRAGPGALPLRVPVLVHAWARSALWASPSVAIRQACLFSGR